MLDQLCSIVKKAGQMILSADMTRAEIEEKSGPGDLITKYDVAVQEMLCDELKKLLPEAGFIGEENQLHSGNMDGYCFIIDPIDGTANFIRGYRHSAVSVALAHRGRLVKGLVYNPYMDELFYAEAGRGAYLNGKRIYASTRELRDGLVLFGSSPYNKEKAEVTFFLVRKMYENALDVRRSGSAALDICYIACGRCELFYEMTLSPWDYAAGSLIVTEAEGIITTMDGDALPLNGKSSVLAAGRQAYEDFRNIRK